MKPLSKDSLVAKQYPEHRVADPQRPYFSIVRRYASRRVVAMECWIPPANDVSNSFVPFECAMTLVAVIELGHRSWLIGRSAPVVDTAVTKTLAKAI